MEEHEDWQKYPIGTRVSVRLHHIEIGKGIVVSHDEESDINKFDHCIMLTSAIKKFKGLVGDNKLYHSYEELTPIINGIEILKKRHNL